MTNEPSALRSLASLVRSGLTLDRTLIEWPARVEDDLRDWANEVARRIELAVPPADAFAAGHTSLDKALRDVFRVHAALGGSVAGSLDALAARLETEQESSSGAAAQAAGAKLSARMISLLPLGAIAFAPGPKLPLDDPVAMTVLLVGVTLVVLGSVWMTKLLPATPQPDLCAAVARALGAVVQGGPAPSQVLDLLAESERDGPLGEASVRVLLGLTWEEALCASDDEGLRTLGRTLVESRTSGAPVAVRLVDLAAERERASILEFEAEARRAPVRMVVPLTVCMLPAFLLLGAGPLVRGLAG